MPYLAVTIAFTAMSVLSLEVVWMRLFAIESFSSFGYMILSVALLGFGIGGILMTLFSGRLAADRERWLFRFALAYPAAAVVSILGSKLIPFVPQNIIQDHAQLAYIGLFYLLLSLPFIAGSLTIGLILTTAGDKVGKLYFADLVGSGLGGVTVLLAFYLVHPRYLSLVVLVLFLPALVAAAYAYPGKGRVRALAVAGATAVACMAALLAFSGLRFSEYKGISYSMASAEVTGAEVMEEAWGPLGYMQVVSSRAERTAPGLSSSAPMEALPPEQKGLYMDGSKVASIARNLEEGEKVYLDWLLTSLPYQLYGEKPPHVLLVGLGGGEGVAQAVHFGAKSVVAADINSVLVELVSDTFADENGGLFQRDDVAAVVADGRDYAARHPGEFDLVMVSFLDASGLSFPGSKSLSENYLYTTESVRQILGALREDGVAVFSTRVNEPPRGSVRLTATVVEGMKGLWGIDDARAGVMYIRSEFYGMTVVKRGGFSDEEVELLSFESFARGFTISYSPGMQKETLEELAREEEEFWQELEESQGVDLSAFESDGPAQDPFYDCVYALLYDEDGGESYLAAYPFAIDPTSDDRPYFSAMLKSGSFDFIRKNAYDPANWEREVPPDLWAQPVVLATLGQAFLFALLILAFPLLAARKRLPAKGKLRNFAYFSCLAAGFMFVEMVLIQKFTLYVAAPAYAAALVLSGMLVFSGIGAAFSSRFIGRQSRGILIAVAGIIVLSVLYNYALTPLLLATMSLPEAVKVVLSIVAVGPVAFFLGMPFPLALSVLSATGDTRLAAWGWAVNGAVSVVGIVLAQALGMVFGYTTVLQIVAVVYLVAWATFPRGQADSNAARNSSGE